MADVKPYWFPAKRYGWGWGPPTAWQGWAVLVVFFLLLLLGAFFFLARQDVLAFVIYTAVLSAALVAVCYVKGEPPAWRWGDKQ
jgi:asparagine N-glycosylation enzyme membrane subunit Stt3